MARAAFLSHQAPTDSAEEAEKLDGLQLMGETLALGDNQFARSGTEADHPGARRPGPHQLAAATLDFLRGKNMKNLIRRFASDEQGLETVEYAVMGALIIGVVVIAIGLLGGAIGARFDEVRAEIQ